MFLFTSLGLNKYSKQNIFSLVHKAWIQLILVDYMQYWEHRIYFKHPIVKKLNLILLQYILKHLFSIRNKTLWFLTIFTWPWASQ